MLNAHVEDIRTFVQAVDAGSISAAARALHVTQSAVTRRLQRLEQAIGAPLMARQVRPLTLTEPGRRALAECRRILAAAEQLQHVGDRSDEASGELRLGVAHALTELVLVTPVKRVAADWPNVRWNVSTAWSHELIERVRSGALDAACVLLADGRPLPGDVRGDKIAAEELLVVAPRAKSRGLKTAASLERWRWILNPDGCAGRAQLQRALGKLGLTLSVAMDAYDYELQLALVAGGRGLGLVPQRLLAKSRSRTRLGVIRIRGLTFPFTVWLVTADADHILADVITALRAALAKQLLPARR
jgi:DNA-binding transcriptional LysR family regulator